MSGVFYQSPPGSAGNDGALPKVYDPMWNFYVNLTPAQVSAFQAFPQDLVIYAKSRRWLAEITNYPLTETVGGQPANMLIDMSDRGQARIDKLSRKWGSNATATTTFSDVNNAIWFLSAANLVAIDTAITTLIEKLFTEMGTLIAGINATPPTVTTRAQIDAAYAAIAPWSPSGTNPSPN